MTVILFWMACAFYGLYSFAIIRMGISSNYAHVMQLLSALVFVLGGVSFGMQVERWLSTYERWMVWHKAGRVLALAVIGIPIYVFGLHLMLRYL